MTGAIVCSLALKTTAQSQIRDFTKPILVFDTDGHSGPVRSLIFTPDGDQLLSAGLDKIINVWNLSGRLGLTRTMRPAIWRGPRGTIYAMALSPVADAQGQRVLAVAGLGLQNQGGNIGLFRYPGLNRLTTGDIEAKLPPTLPEGQVPWGHVNTVMALAFSPDGRFLASASLDGTVRIWDVRARKGVAALADHVGPVNCIAFTEGGKRLISGGADGALRLWDVERKILIKTKPAPARAVANPGGEVILALAVSPDSKWVVVGRENSELVRYAASDLERETVLPKKQAGQGPVEALAISPDGTRLVTSIVSQRIKNPYDFPSVACDIELRSMPGGEVVSLLQKTTNLVYAVAFSPNGRLVAFAGGDTQSIMLVNPDEPIASRRELRGQGSSLWDVGFDSTSRVVGYARERPDPRGDAVAIDGFDLAAREPKTIERATFRRATTTLDGNTIRPTGVYSLEVARPRNVKVPLKLDENNDRRWWSYTFIPPGPGHPRLTVAVGCESGVILFDAETGQRTRHFAGHNGAVYAVAPSPDGRWLASGGVDQTLRLWSLAGCDVVPALGAKFEQNGGVWTAVSVAPRGFAEAMGLQKGDIIKEFGIDGRRLDPKQLALADTAKPNTRIEFTVFRGAQREQIPLLTTKRDSPALSYFAGLNGEWVLWMPEGYYDTSIAGDRKYLGWHRNGPTVERPTDFFPIDVFEQELRRPQVLDRLIATGDSGQALAALNGPVVDTEKLAESGPPVIRILEPARPAEAPLGVVAAPLSVRAQVGTPDRRPVRAVRVLVDNRVVQEQPINPPRPEVDARFDLVVEPGLHRINVVAVNDRDKTRTEGFDVDFSKPKPPESRLSVLSIGIDKFRETGVPPIPFADVDANDVGAFVAAPGGQKRFQEIDTRVLIGPDASGQGMSGALGDLGAKLDNGRLGRGDLVFVFLESHFLQFDRDRRILGSDATLPLPGPGLMAEELAERLGRVSEFGCTVVLLLDVVHAPRTPGWDGRVAEWVRDLYRKRGVIVFLASTNNRPGLRVVPKRHGVFAQAVLESHDAISQSRLSSSGDGPMSLGEFADRVASRVQELTGRKQYAGGYWSETTSSSLPILSPRSSSPSVADR